ncbi:divalent metal cation transporter [Halalkalibacterium halodurans]|uniref:NRAMP family divalent metal transporter n=1 Tax=Halalkalibacterium halodurans TaxID=86665 RepID=UPI00031BA5D4|nr:NRAMP family divalent metal transporter [Halalkalibacterium halodurans]MED3648417.1 divalent metal cation transporter [Halalkalibacterium halodurans]MED4082313.1 divalent metal cation transporter [Halalkalibacterium halodurans]MED4083536.1 divalent metal cation transporter [Halalkalibacterium halodurans]MED4105849.1 divalent metal cation transporter [Halalkalibacterium halodurans]MED4109961.1 divalent metal cation transporter [Halalkalibacterium halodurans]
MKQELMEKELTKKRRLTAMMGATFLMATSAIGPGFLTQTAVFTEQLLASFAFVILASIILDIGAQLNIWRIIAVTKMKGQDIANTVLPGLGYVVAFFIILGGLAFNIGNVAGGGLGSNALLGISPTVGAILTGVICIIIFLLKEAQVAMDKIVRYLGALMILLTAYVMIVSKPPYGEALVRSVVPLEIDFLAIVTLVGGTVGGYITFAGGHRLLEAGISGKENLRQVTNTAISGIVVASVMRIILFLAILGVVVAGYTLNPDNPTADVFKHAAGEIGYRLFGLVFWAAGITSVIGAAYTSVSFLTTFHPSIERNKNYWTIGFIVFSTSVFALVGQPVTLLVLAGAFNGLILPLTLGCILLAAHQKKIVGDYNHPIWLTIFGAIVVILTLFLGIRTLMQMIPQLF